MLKGFVFDLDGVITDTARYHYEAWKRVAEEETGIVIDESVNEQLKGLSRMDSLNTILKFGHKEEAYTDTEKAVMASEKNDYYLKLIQNMTPADILPGIKDFLDAIKAAGYKAAIASASKNAPTIIERLGLITSFDGIVDPSTLRKGKPDPEIFERAAALIQLDNSEVVGVEDAAAGIAGINAAGQFSVGIGDPRILEDADLNFRSTSELDLSAIQAVFSTKQ